jgi:hypothetical protein
MATRDLPTAVLLTIIFLIFLESINFEDENFENGEEDYDRMGIFVNY